MTTTSRPRHPLSGMDPHLWSPRHDMRTWFLAPGAMINEILDGTVIDADLARHMSVDVKQELRRRFPGVGTYIGIHDFSHAAGHDPEGRRILTEWAVTGRDEIRRIVLITSPDKPLLRMAISAATAVLRVRGLSIEVAPTMAEAIARCGIATA